MAELVIAAAGSWVGSAVAGTAAPIFLGMTGAQLGWAVGGIVGNMLFAPTVKSHGPRLDDLKVTISSYGANLPYLIGAGRIAGNVVWASEKREIATTTSQGKGGGAESTTYTYEADVLFELTENVCEALLAVYSDGKLIWTGDSSSPSSSIMASDTVVHWNRLTFYSGAPDQLPDPTYEAFKGAGNASAFRGRSTVFIESLNLPGGSLPNLTFRLAQYATSGDAVSSYVNFVGMTGIELPEGGAGTCFAADTAYHYQVYRWNGYVTMYCNMRIQRGNREGVAVMTHDFQPPNSVQTYSWAYGTCPVVCSGGNPRVLTRGEVGFNAVQAGTHHYYVTDLVTGASELVLTFYSGTGDGNDLNPMTAWCAYDHLTDRYIVFDVIDPARRTQGTFMPGLANGTADGHRTAVLPATCGAPAFYDDVVYILYDDGVSSYVRRYTGGGGVATEGGVFIDQTTALPRRVTITQALIKASSRGVFVWDPTNSTDALYKLVEPGDAWVTLSYRTGLGGRNIPNAATNSSIRDFYATDSYLQYVENSVNPGVVKTLVFNSATPGSRTLVQAVTELCLRAGLRADQFDTSGIASVTRPVRGLLTTQAGDTRSALSILMSAFSVYTAGGADKLYFRRLDDAAAATVPYSALGAGIDRHQDNPFTLREANDIEVPAQTAVSFLDVDRDYQTNTQYSDRILSVQGNLNQVQMPLAMTASEGKAVADVLESSIAASLLTSTVSVARSYTALQAGDAVNLTDDDGSVFRMRIMRRTATGPVISWEVVSDDASVYEQAGLTNASPGSQTTVTGSVTTHLYPLDLPMLRDSDNDHGVYVAATGGTGWPGAIAYSSRDDQVFSEEATILSAAAMGAASSVLGAYTGPTLFDEVNTVTVWLYGGALSSSTRAAILRSRDVNLAMVGNELIQFRDATLVSTNVYRLSGLLRGRRGTKAYRSGHAIGDRFVLLNETGVRRDDLQLSDLGQTRYYRGVTLRARLSSAESVVIVPTGKAVKPRAPVDLRVNRATADAVLTWVPQTRYSHTFCGDAGIRVPFGETVVKYELEFWNSAYTTLIRTVLGLTAATYTYTSALQTADFGGVQTHLYCKVYQLNDLVGRGEALVAIASGGAATPFLLLHCDGTDASTTFTDSSAAARTVTVGGNAQIDTAQSRLGTASGLFDGSGDYLSVPGGLTFGANDFTIEFYMRNSAFNSPAVVAGVWGASGQRAWRIDVASTGISFLFSASGSGSDSPSIVKTQTIELNTWYHVAIVRKANFITVYIDGVGGTPTAVSSAMVSTSQVMWIGGNTDAGGVWYYTGWIDEFRILNSAAYITDFTPPQFPF